MGVSQSKGYLFEGVLGSMIGSPQLGNYHTGIVRQWGVPPVSKLPLKTIPGDPYYCVSPIITLLR